MNEEEDDLMVNHRAEADESEPIRTGRREIDRLPCGYPMPPPPGGGVWVRWAVGGTLVVVIAIGGAGFTFAMNQQAALAALKQQVNDKIEMDQRDRSTMIDSIRREFDTLRQDIKDMRADGAADRRQRRDTDSRQFNH